MITVVGSPGSSSGDRGWLVPCRRGVALEECFPGFLALSLFVALVRDRVGIGGLDLYCVVAPRGDNWTFAKCHWVSLCFGPPQARYGIHQCHKCGELANGLQHKAILTLTNGTSNPVMTLTRALANGVLLWTWLNGVNEDLVQWR